MPPQRICQTIRPTECCAIRAEERACCNGREFALENFCGGDLYLDQNNRRKGSDLRYVVLEMRALELVRPLSPRF